MTPSATNKILDPSPRRSSRLRNTHVVYDEYSEKDISTLKCVKTEIIEEIVSPSKLELNAVSIGSKDGGEHYYDVSLKDLRAHCKAKNRKAQKVSSDGPNTTDHTQYGNVVMEKSIEELDLDAPLISLKQKSQKTPPSKAKRKMDAPKSSPHALNTSKRDNTSPVQASQHEVPLHDSAARKFKRRRTVLEHSKIAANLTEEIVMEDTICCEIEDTVLSAGALTNSGSPGAFCKLNTEDIDIYINGEVGVSRPVKNSVEHLSVQLLQVPIEDDGRGQQPCFITQPSELLDVSDNSCELTHSVEAHSSDNIVLKNKTSNLVSSLDCTDEVRSHPIPSDMVSSDVTVGNEYLTCSVNQSCDGDKDNDEYWHPGVQHSPKSITIVEESSPSNEFDTEMQSPLVVVQSDMCRSTDRTCTSLDEVVQMQVDGQFDPLVCHGARPKDVLLHIDQAATTYNFAFDKTLDFVQITNCATEDGQLESIVYDALNNHAQRKDSGNKTFVGAREAAMVSSPREDGFIDNCPNEHDGEILFSDNTEWSSKDMGQLNATTDGENRRSNNEQRSREQSVFQPQLIEVYADMEKTASVTSESSIPEEIQEPAGGYIGNSLETEGHHLESGLLTDEGSIEEHAPKKLLSKRKIMSPTSQEKLCNALTCINLCGVQRLKRKILLEDCDKIRRTLPNEESKQGQSVFSTDMRLKRTLSPTKKILKAESSSPQKTTSCCMRSSSVLFDAEKAVEFSQRQMHDIESIAGKLIRSLKHMKSIVDESLSSEEAHSSLRNFSTAEIMAASEDALEVERTTRKWLTIMNKDCNRFCKILTLAGKKSISRPEVPRKQRKIIFADEAGGTLCHVKVFNDGQRSLSENEREF